MDNIKLSKRGTIIAIIILLLFILIPVAFFINSRINNATIDLLVAPESSSIYIDNHKVTNGEIGVTAGKHTVTAKKDGFAEQTITIDAIADQTVPAYIILDSNDKSTENWFKNHPEDQKIVEQISSREHDSSSNQYVDDNPIIKYLPFETANYTLNYGSCEASTFCIFIDTRPADYDKIVGIIKELTDDPARYSYVFKDYINPFQKIKTTSENPSQISVSDEKSAIDFIEKTLKDYPHFLNPLTLVNDYFVGSFSYRISDYPDINTYHFIIQKDEKGSWGFVSTPQMIPTYQENQNIPKEVVKKANEQ